MSRTALGTGNVVSGEVDVFAAPLAAYQSPGTVPGVIMCHGSGRIATDITNPVVFGEYAIYDALRQLYCVGIGDFGFNAWGNNTAIADVEAKRVQMQSAPVDLVKPQAKSGKVALIGASMGSCSALNYALAHPANVACIALFIPAVGPLTNPVLSTAFQAAVKSGSTYSESVDGPTHNPQNATYQANFPNIPVHLWYSDGDLTAYPAAVTAFAAGVPSAMAIRVSTTLDHTEDAIAAAPLADVLAFIAANLS